MTRKEKILAKREKILADLIEDTKRRYPVNIVHSPDIKPSLSTYGKQPKAYLAYNPKSLTALEDFLHERGHAKRMLGGIEKGKPKLARPMYNFPKRVRGQMGLMIPAALMENTGYEIPLFQAILGGQLFTKK